MSVKRQKMTLALLVLMMFTNLSVAMGQCPPVTNLAAVVNGDNTVTLSWTNPAQSQWPAEFGGDLYFQFYNGSYGIGSSDVDNLTSWTTPVLSEGTHSLGVRLMYWRNSGGSICSSDTARVSVTIAGSGTGIENATQNVSLYPNPANDEVSVVVGDLDSEATATILDVQGKVVGKYAISAATGRANIDVSALTDGTYIVRIASQEAVRVERLVIKR